MGVLAAADRLGVQVPGGLSVIGFDDIALASLLGLSTVRQPLEESGAEGARRLCALLRGERVRPLRQLLSLQLVERESTALSSRVSGPKDTALSSRVSGPKDTALSSRVSGPKDTALSSRASGPEGRARQEALVPAATDPHTGNDAGGRFLMAAVRSVRHDLLAQDTRGHLRRRRAPRPLRARRTWRASIATALEG
jgi:substrate-binding family protein